MRRLATKLGVLLLAVNAASVEAQSIGPAWKQDDPRLKAEVAVSAEHITVGDVLERLSAIANLDLRCGQGRDGSADHVLAMFVQHTELADVMEALRSLFSYRRAEWQWRRSGTPGQYRYSLERPLAARRLSQSLQQEIQAKFEAQAGSLLKCNQLSDSALKQKAEAGDWQAKALLDSPRLRGGLRLLSEVVPPSGLQQVMRGRQLPPFPVSALSQSGKEFVHSVWVASKAVIRRPDGSFQPEPEPNSLQLYLSRSPQLTPTLVIGLEGIGGYGYIGGTPLHEEFDKELQDRWMLPGDTRSPDYLSAKVGAVTNDAGAHLDNKVLGQMRRLSLGLPVSVLVRLTDEERPDPGPADGRVMQEYLTRLVDRSRLHWKDRGHVLLAADPAWIYEEEDGRIPWPVVKRLNAAEATNGGLFTLLEIENAANVLTAKQFARLGTLFPSLSGIFPWQSLLRRAARSPTIAQRMRSPQGVPLESVWDAAAVTPIAETIHEARGLALHLSEMKRRDRGDPVSTALFDVIDSRGEVIGGGGFSWTTRKGEAALHQ